MTAISDHLRKAAGDLMQAAEAIEAQAAELNYYKAQARRWAEAANESDSTEASRVTLESFERDLPA